jgi:uncharacterized protein
MPQELSLEGVHLLREFTQQHVHDRKRKTTDERPNDGSSGAGGLVEFECESIEHVGGLSLLPFHDALSNPEALNAVSVFRRLWTETARLNCVLSSCAPKFWCLADSYSKNFPMTQANINQPLSKDELNRLAVHLSKMGPQAMNLETLDGYFSALICGPEPVIPSEYLPEIWGDDFVFDSEAQMSEIAGLSSRHWNAIISGLDATMKHRKAHLPIMLAAPDGVTYGNDWALGFMRGVRMRSESWRDLMASEEDGGSVVIIMAFAHENDPDPTMRPSEPFTAARRKDLLVEMITSLARIYRYFAPYRRRYAAGARPLKRAALKLGRNDPCHCGSGRKFKHCCASLQPTLH